MAICEKIVRVQTERFTRPRFEAIWTRLAGAAPRDSLFADLQARYSESHRAYHTVQHIDECLALLDLLDDVRPRLELAIWFHDAIYDPRATDNEERSADWAARELMAAGVADSVAADVRSLILVTRHTSSPASPDEKLVTDVDLAILGAEPARFAEYDHQIRQEYSWVPSEVYARERARVLRSFLDRPSIYATDFFRQRFEAPARRNLQQALMAA